MKQFLQKNSKILMLCLFLMMTLCACSAPRGSDGLTKADQIISSEELVLTKDQVNVDDISDEEVKAQFEKELEETGQIVIEPTSWSSAFSQSWFTGLIVWPIAQLINLFSSLTDAGWGIILATLLIQVIIFAFTYKSQASSQRMQEIQPEMQKIQNKYKDKTDQQSQMRMAQETQELYKKYDIHPFGSMLVMFIQLPIMMGMYYATMRAASVIIGSFMGMPLSETPITAFQNRQIGPIVVYILMIVFQLLNTKLPQWLQKWQDKKDNVKKKKYDSKNDQASGMMGSMNTMMYFTTAMIAVMYISWPIAMTFYWMVSSIIRTVQQIIMHFVNHKHTKEKEAQQQQTHSILKNKKK